MQDRVSAYYILLAPRFPWFITPLAALFLVPNISIHAYFSLVFIFYTLIIMLMRS